MTFSKYIFLSVILTACAGSAEDPDQGATQTSDLKTRSLVKVGAQVGECTLYAFISSSGKR